MAPDIMSNISSSLEIGNRYLMIILLMARLSTHILHEPSFLGVGNARTAHRLTFFDEPLTQQFVNLPFEFGVFRQIHSIVRQFGERRLWDQIDSVLDVTHRR